MQKMLYLGNNPVVLGIEIEPQRQVELDVRLNDADITNSIYADRSVIIKKKQKIYLRLPESPMVADLRIYNTAGNNDGFKVTEVKELPLDRHLELFDSKNALIKSYIKFIQKFAKRASYLTAGKRIEIIPDAFEHNGKKMPGYFTVSKTYYSEDKKFRIDYVEQCIDRESGKASTTPMRISEDRGIIEAAKKFLKPVPISYIVAWGLHEFSHFWLNDISSDEEEADYHAARIFLGLGYSPADLLEAFLAVFDNRDTPQNRERWEKFVHYVTEYDLKYNKYR